MRLMQRCMQHGTLAVWLQLSWLLAAVSSCRHVARKHGLYGSGEAEMAAVDQIIDGVEVRLMQRSFSYW